MMLTINDIRNANLTKTMMGGYKIEEVDDLLIKICQTLEMNEKQKGELTKKLKILGDRVEQYRSDEQMIKNALYDAQKKKIEAEEEAEHNARRIMETAERKTEEVKLRLQKEIQNALNEAKEIKAKAQMEAKDIKTRAQIEADELLRDCEKQRNGILYEVENAKQDYLELQNKIVMFRNELIDTYKAHLKLVAGLPSSETVKEAARQLDEMYPTGKVTKVTKDSTTVHHNDVEQDFDRLIQQTLEFNIDDVQKGAVKDSEKADTDEKLQTQNESVSVADMSEEYTAEFEQVSENNTDLDDEKQRVRIKRPDKRGKISFSSKTVIPPKQSSTIENEDIDDEASGIRIVEVDRGDNNPDIQPRASRFFS